MLDRQVMEPRFAGKVAMVSGAASGIGAAVVQRLRAEGAQVVAVGLQWDLLARVAADWGGTALPCDITDEAQVQAVVAGMIHEGALRLVDYQPGARDAVLEVPHD